MYYCLRYRGMPRSMLKYTNLLQRQTTRLTVFTGLLLLITQPVAAKNDTLTVHFLYGSKPAKGYKHIESKWFGGLHGGHVTIQLGDYLYGFGPNSGKTQVFSKRKNFRSSFRKESHQSWASDTAGMKYLSVKIPVDSALHDSLQKVFDQWMQNTPYDYAFFGMRCASTAYHGLSKIGITKKRGKFGMTYKYFYPKLLRKKLLKKAKTYKWDVFFHKGKVSRKWEKD